MRCRRPVEFQNLGAPGNVGKKLVASAEEAVRLNPDAVLLTVTPFDFEPSAVVDAGPPPKPNLLNRVRDRASSSSLLYMESYYLLRDDAAYVPLYTGLGPGADFMRSPLSAEWRRRLSEFDASVSVVAAIAKRRSVPVLLVFIPQRAQAAIASPGRHDSRLNPELLPQALQKIASEHGMAFADTIPTIPRNTPSSSIFYAMNGHLNADGHALVSRLVTDRLVGPAMAPFAQACNSGEVNRPGLAGGPNS